VRRQVGENHSLAVLEPALDAGFVELNEGHLHRSNVEAILGIHDVDHVPVMQRFPRNDDVTRNLRAADLHLHEHPPEEGGAHTGASSFVRFLDIHDDADGSRLEVNEPLTCRKRAVHPACMAAARSRTVASTPICSRSVPSEMAQATSIPPDR
jgi:hypothetical protein